MTVRLYDLEKITKYNWNAPHQWRYKDKNIEFGLETCHGMEWFSYIQAPSKIVDLVCSYKKMLPKIELRENDVSNDLQDFDEEQKQVIEEAKRYLSLRNPEDDVINWDDDRVLKAINRYYFGGIQRFAKYHKEKRGQ